MKNHHIPSIRKKFSNLVKNRYSNPVLFYFVLNIGLSNNTVVKMTHLLK